MNSFVLPVMYVLLMESNFLFSLLLVWFIDWCCIRVSTLYVRVYRNIIFIFVCFQNVHMQHYFLVTNFSYYDNVVHKNNHPLCLKGTLTTSYVYVRLVINNYLTTIRNLEIIYNFVYFYIYKLKDLSKIFFLRNP